MSYMFAYTKVPELDLSNFNTGNVTKMNYMFYYMDGIKEIDITNFDTQYL